jgi:hypothetical protein
MAVRLSALWSAAFYTPGRFLVLISLRDLVDPRAIVRLEGLSQLREFRASELFTALLKLHILKHKHGICVGGTGSPIKQPLHYHSSIFLLPIRAHTCVTHLKGEITTVTEKIRDIHDAIAGSNLELTYF